MNTANKITLARLIFVPIFLVVMLLPSSVIPFEISCIIGAALFICASITDALDGNIARKYNMITDFGKFLDPLADKFMVIGALFVIIYRFEEPLRFPFLILSIIIVFRVIPYQIGLVLIPAALLFLDRRALKSVDYGLLATFVCFFIFAGNMARIPAVSALFSSLLEQNTLVFSILSCQVISNVPSAILLSQFTLDYPALLLGVNIGGTGTLIASLASLISFREYTAHNPGRAGSYLAKFSAYNFGFVIVLTLLCLFIL